ncbi:MAG: TlpA family protein disulfide reductase [Lachnotalea sp.]
MNNNSLKKMERVLLIIFIVLGVIAIAGVILLIRFGNNTSNNEGNQSEEEQQVGEQTYDWEAGLSDNTLWLPNNCEIYSKIPEFTFFDEQGNTHSISDFEGKPTVVVFWASWCSDCQEQMPIMNQYIQSSKAYGDVQFIFVNKTDGEKETEDSAISYFQNLGIDETLYFDKELDAYNTLGIHNIPTTLFINEDGIITEWSPKQITEVTKFDALLKKALFGGSYATSDFITSRMMDDEGAIHSSYDETSSSTFSSDVLSESEGAMLEYAILSEKQELFDQILDYIQTNLGDEGLTPWVISTSQTSKVNALVDDLRIYKSIDGAQQLWGGYEKILEQYKKLLITYGTYNGKFVDFYDADSKEYASRFTLCYGDLKAMKLLAEGNSDVKVTYDSCESIVVNGQISNDFPLYYSWYNYSDKKYEKDELNTAEAMLTLLHLAEVDLLPDNTLSWIETQMQQSGVKARYTVDGTISEGYNYDSTAVYALIAMIGVEEGDKTLINEAVKKMEKMRIDDDSLDYNGAFGMEDGSGISSFDQVMPLITYMKIYGK